MMPLPTGQDRKSNLKNISMVMISARIFVYFIDYGLEFPSLGLDCST